MITTAQAQKTDGDKLSFLKAGDSESTNDSGNKIVEFQIKEALGDNKTLVIKHEDK